MLKYLRSVLVHRSKGMIAQYTCGGIRKCNVREVVALQRASDANAMRAQQQIQNAMVSTAVLEQL